MPDAEPSPSALSALRILDLSTGIAGGYCTKLLADYGAEVVKVEMPGTGDSLRQWGPFPEDDPDVERGLLHWYLNANKRSTGYPGDQSVSKNDAFNVARPGISGCDSLGATVDPTSAYPPIRPWMSSQIFSQVTAAESQPEDLKDLARLSASASAPCP